MEVDSRLMLLILCGFPWETIESVIELLKKHPTYPFLKRSGPIETPMRPGRGSHVTDGKPHIVIRSR
jgi:hypothetical protein